MSKQNEQQQFFKGAFLLTYAGLFGKVLSAIYRIPLQNLTGDVGFYIYQQIYPFIGASMILALYGFPAAISRIIARQSNQSNQQLRKRILVYLMICSGSVFILIYTLAPQLARLMSDIGLIPAIRVSAFSFLLVPFVSYFRGLFQGENNMIPTAISQMVEQIIRVSLIIVTAYLIVKLNRSLYDVGFGTAIATIIGSLLSLLSLMLFYARRERTYSTNAQIEQVTNKNLFKEVIGYGLAIAINHMVLLLLQFVDVFTLVPLLRKTGISLFDAQVLKGVLDRGQPLAQFGIVAASSLALALIPSVTKLRLKNDRKRFTSYVASTWRFTLYLASGATVGLIVLFPEVNTLLFKVDLGSISLRIFSVTIIFSALSISTASILQGLGYIYQTALFVIVGMIAKLILNLMLIPMWGIKGGALATVLSSLIILLLNVYYLKRHTNELDSIVVPWFKLVTVLSIMGVVVYSLNLLGRAQFYQFSRFGQFIYLVCMIVIGVTTYILSLKKFAVFTKEEQEVLPLKFIKKG